jgi:2-polyprenyl-6-methoxyphenol 4-hydroxylase
MTANLQHYDLIIIGGGMVGASLAALLSHQPSQPLRILIVESFPLPEPSSKRLYQPSFDARSTALSGSTRKIYEAIDLWPVLEQHLSPIERIHVSDRGHWGSTLMDCADEGLPALGYVVENQWLGTVLLQRLEQSDKVHWCCPARALDIRQKSHAIEVEVETGTGSGAERQLLSAGLVVIADGARSSICQKLGIGSDELQYGQSAVIANVTLSEPHRQVAYERFTDQGPMALLPLEDQPKGEHRSALIWTLPLSISEQWLQASDEDFLDQLQLRFGYRLGRFRKVGKRFAYPLSLMQAREQIRSGIVVMGNAAHSLHPVAGQGFNLALRDVAVLTEELGAALERHEPIGALAVLQRYQDRQSSDQRLTIGFSDQMPRLFGINQPLVEIARGTGLVALDILPAAKSAFVGFASGLNQ